MRRRVHILAVTLTLQGALVSGCSARETQPGTTGDEEKRHGHVLQPSSTGRELLKRCPLPGWWDSVEAPRVATDSQLLDYRQGQQFTPEQLFKVCFTATVEHLDETPPDVAMLAVSLISHGDPTYRYDSDLYAFILDRYGDYDCPLVNSGGRAGDTVAGLVEDSARILLGEGRNAEARDVIENLLTRRRREINPQLLQLLSLKLADAYAALGDRDRARAVLTQALTYPGDWDQRIQQALDQLESEGEQR